MLETALQSVRRTMLTPTHQVWSPGHGLVLRQTHAGSGRILFPKATRSTECISRMPRQELPLATTEQFSERQMMVTLGWAKQVERRIISTPFHLLMQITERPLAGMESF